LNADFTEDIMELNEFLNSHKTDILNEAAETLQRAQLKSYSASTSEKNKNRLEQLLQHTITGVQSKNLVGMIEYAEKIAQERFEAGFDLHEVHTAFNVLEETIWKMIIDNFEPSGLGKALGLVSTVVGAGKESLAITYVSLSGKNKTKTLNLSELFAR
jgi:hypothetical protein